MLPRTLQTCATGERVRDGLEGERVRGKGERGCEHQRLYGKRDPLYSKRDLLYSKMDLRYIGKRDQRVSAPTLCSLWGCKSLCVTSTQIYTHAECVLLL